MQSGIYNTSRTSRNLFRERSLSNLPSRQMSVMDILQRKESIMIGEAKRMEEEQNVMLAKDSEINKLKSNLQTAVSAALRERLQNSRTKQQIAGQVHHKRYLQGKIKTLQRENKMFQQRLSMSQSKNVQMGQMLADQNERNVLLQKQVSQKMKEITEKRQLQAEIERCKVMLKDIDLLKARIMVLEEQNRLEKIKNHEGKMLLEQREKEKAELIKEVAKAKPKEQQLKEKIAYLQRVSLDMDRKMEDYNRRENEYIKTITSLKTTVTKLTADRNMFKTSYEQTIKKYETLKANFDQLSTVYQGKLKVISQLEKEVAAGNESVLALRVELEEKAIFYKSQGEENLYLRERNKILQQIELELRRVIEGYVRISEQVNLTIVARCEEIKTLKATIESYKQQIEETEQKFAKFDKLLEEGSEKGFNAIREGYYVVLRENNENVTKLKEMKLIFDQKFILMGEERDILNRNKEIRSVGPPSDESQFLSIFHQKTESIVLLENSNDQLLKVKKDLENKIQQLLEQLQKERKEMMLLKLKTADLFRAKKDLQQARKKMERYQEMIQEQNQQADDMQSQINILRAKNSQMNEKHFVIQLQKRNLEVKIAETNEVIKELNLEVLQNKKEKNDKNAHLITDSVQKLEAAVKSLAFFFNCAFCGQFPLMPVTLAMCGHNYCSKCKDAYAESCYQCDTGMPIEKVFQNRFLKDAGGKYKFLTMVLSQLKSNFLDKS